MAGYTWAFRLVNFCQGEIFSYVVGKIQSDTSSFDGVVNFLIWIVARNKAAGRILSVLAYLLLMAGPNQIYIKQIINLKCSQINIFLNFKFF